MEDCRSISRGKMQCQQTKSDRGTARYAREEQTTVGRGEGEARGGDGHGEGMYVCTPREVLQPSLTCSIGIYNRSSKAVDMA
jgi:hypothetical protein